MPLLTHLFFSSVSNRKNIVTICIILLYVLSFIYFLYDNLSFVLCRMFYIFLYEYRYAEMSDILRNEYFFDNYIKGIKKYNWEHIRYLSMMNVLWWGSSEWSRRKYLRTCMLSFLIGSRDGPPGWSRRKIFENQLNSWILSFIYF